MGLCRQRGLCGRLVEAMRQDGFVYSDICRGTKGEDTMRKLEKDQKTLEAVICNGCGRTLKVENGELKEGCFEGKQTFGYFSSMDGERHSFDLCEECYKKLLAGFAVAAEREEITELV